MKEREKRGKTLDTPGSSFLTTAVSLLCEKPLSNRAAIPILQTKSAETRVEFTEARTNNGQLKTYVKALREYRETLVRGHGLMQERLVAYERETLSLQSSSPSDLLSFLSDQNFSLVCTGRQLSDLRNKQRIELSLYQKSKAEQVAGWDQAEEESRRRVKRLARKMREIDKRDRDNDRKYTEEMAKREKDKAEIEMEIMRIRQERMKDQLQILHLQRKALFVLPEPPHSPMRRQNSDGGPLTAKEILTKLRKRLCSNSSGSLRRSYHPLTPH